MSNATTVRIIADRKMRFKNELLKIIANSDESDSLAYNLIEFIFNKYSDYNEGEREFLDTAKGNALHAILRCYL